MMTFKLSDIFIGEYPLSQSFGADPATYAARYKLKGHNGTDFATPSGTMILAAADGWVMEAGFDAGGYGKYVKIIHEGYLTLYAHLNDYVVNVKDRVIAGQLIGHSNNTGFSTGPHLHFGVAPCDQNGIKTEVANGYSGYIDSMGSRCEWKLKHPTTPALPMNSQRPPVAVPSDQFVDLVTKSTNWDVVSAFFNLTDLEKIDPKGGEHVIQKVSEILADKRKLTERLQELEPATPPPGQHAPDPTPPPPDPLIDVTPEEHAIIEKTPFLKKDIKDLFTGFLHLILFKK